MAIKDNKWKRNPQDAKNCYRHEVLGECRIVAETWEGPVIGKKNDYRFLIYKMDLVQLGTNIGKMVQYKDGFKTEQDALNEADRALNLMLS